MQNEEYDLDKLASFLHLEKKQVERLVSRGKIPGKRVDGQWKFSSIEIHHWLEERLGVLDEGELAKMEGAMARQSTALPEDSSVEGLLSPERIALPFQAKTKSSVISSICKLAGESGLLWDIERMADAVKEREDMYTTALDCGAALLHPRRPMPGILAQPLLTLGITPRGIPFGDSGILTDVFWLICSTHETTHLKTLARLSRLMTMEGFLDEIREAGDSNEVYKLACQFEQELK